ncbi:MAG: 4'-phosphopantetheinyl transferase superfamily protein, partial [Lachnospiraceae bacterium]|nr:4'-phosphopantetheinyl transferase superfamily protein [Lachnospiraceae bacterium]
SHCKKGVLCVIDEKPVGCDIEQIPEKLNMSVCRKCFNEDEIDKILNADNPCVEFTKFWTKKEALLKLSGIGITVDLKNILNKENTFDKSIQTIVCEEKGYVYSVIT